MTFKFLGHTADVKILVEEETVEKAFKSSALAMREVIISKKKIGSGLKKDISIKTEDKESLLYAFLEEFLYLLDAKDFILSNIPYLKIIKEGKEWRLKARLLGNYASNYKINSSVKAITYNEMFVKETKDKTIIQFVLDV